MISARFGSHCRPGRAHGVVVLAALFAVSQGPAAAQGRGAPPPAVPAPTAPPAVERLGKDLVRIGRVTVNTATREASVRGTVNPVSTLEFLANTPRGLKAYESALTLESDGVTFNTALVLIGLDRANAHLLPNRSLDGDRVELWVEVEGTPARRFRAERLIFDRATNQELPESSWIYSGSMFQPNGLYLADLEGVLIGFVHSRAAVIEHAETIGVGRYGSVVLNPNLGLQPGSAITLTVKALSTTATP
jgi:hypothetical protein